MSALPRLARWCLDAAARRWPADIRDEMAQEWHAELAAIEAEPGGARQGLTYALSLLTSPPLRDTSGAPRGWAEAGRPAPAAVLVLTGLFTLAVAQLAESLTTLLLPEFGVEAYALTWPPAVVNGILLAGWCLAAGRWLGRRMPLDPGARLGPATSAEFAPLLLTPALLAPAMIDPHPTYLLGLLAGLLIWIPGIAVLGAFVVRGRLRVRALVLGAPLVSTLAAAVATLPMIAFGQGDLSTGLRAAAASLLGTSPPDEIFVIEDGVSSAPFFYLGPWAITLSTFAVLALAYGIAALRPLPPRPVLDHQDPADEPAVVPVAVTAAGAIAVALAVAAWAYTLAILTPAMPGVSASAPMPGGDGEIYLWVAELRWGAILLAVLGMLVAAADRRRPVTAAVTLAAALLLGNTVLLHAGVSGAGGLRLALLVGTGAAGAAWFLAGGPLAGAGVFGTVRRRATAGAVIAAACSPLLLSQGTPGVNHPFLPAGLVPVTTGLAALGVLLGGAVAVALSRRLPWWAAVLLLVVPAAAVAAAGLAPVPVDSESTGDGVPGVLAGVPVAVIVVGLLRRHRPRRRGRTAALWALLAVAGPAGSMVLWLAAVFLAMFVPSVLFAIEGSGYPADGLSVVPGAALLVTPVAVLAAARLDGTPAPVRRPDPVPDLVGQ